jgi:hypothetical protein
VTARRVGRRDRREVEVDLVDAAILDGRAMVRTAALNSRE